MGLRRAATLFAIVQGGYMLADAVHRLWIGAYFGAGLGPWARIAASSGIDPVSPAMALVFVVFGALWLAAAVALAFGRYLRAVAVLAIASLWYLPLGTLISAVVLVAALRAVRTAGRDSLRAQS